MFAADSKVSAGHKDASRTRPVPSWKQLIAPIEPFLDEVNRRLVAQVQTFDPGVAPYADYALNGQGKQLRPALVGLTGEALGRLEDSHVTAAVIIEMVHLATLVHDDVMDEAEIRRGRLTLASNWGNDIAVLFGDCLFAQALKLAADFPTPEVCRAVSSATNTVVSGEILQTTHSRDFKFTRDQYYRVLEMKTGELFALSCELSAFLAGTGPDCQASLRQFGLALGTAYQIYDDCVDLFGTEAMAGKSLGTDLAKGKLTLPLLLTWERADAEDRARLRVLVEDWRNGSMNEMAGLLAKYETLRGSVEGMRHYLDKARRALRKLPVSQGRDRLLHLTEFLAQQTSALGAVTESGA